MDILFRAVLVNKWLILLIFEILAWVSTFLMFYTRYFLKSKTLFIFATILGTTTGVIPQISLGVLNFINEKKIDAFLIVILLLILFSCTFGKKLVKKLDEAIVKWADRKRNNIE